mmetsp:Transcript_14612/g.40609  ORF Transcript_14612/g.40609 Transcript_14612/m.40609 type:complete len:362 (+) Transcript_14612:78-1163(+)
MNVILSRRTTTKVMGLQKALRQSRGSIVSYFSTDWSGNLSFASPEADFVSAPKAVHMETSNSSVTFFPCERTNPTWSRNLSFSTPESDFVSAPQTTHLGISTPSLSNFSPHHTNQNWTETISFATPESDYVSAPEEVHASSRVAISCSSSNAVKRTWSQTLSFASPESDFTFASETESPTNSTFQELFQNHHLYISPETATGCIAYNEMLDEATKDMILKKIALKESIPKTMEDALNDERPVIVTSAESPFRVVDVNGAWEGLCGYRRDEAIGRNLRSLLQGSETDIETANNAVRSLREIGFSEAVLTNYTKNGREFQNHLKLGKIPATDSGDRSSSSNDIYFVGVLHDMGSQNKERVVSL